MQQILKEIRLIYMLLAHKWKGETSPEISHCSQCRELFNVLQKFISMFEHFKFKGAYRAMLGSLWQSGAESIAANAARVKYVLMLLFQLFDLALAQSGCR